MKKFIELRATDDSRIWLDIYSVVAFKQRGDGTVVYCSGIDSFVLNFHYKDFLDLYRKEIGESHFS
jgi:hypothetical protein